MLRNISTWLYCFSRGWVALAALAIFLLFGALVLPGQAAAARVYSAAAGSPDTSLFYSPSDLLRMAESYGESGRQAYVRARFTFDLAFPLVFTFFLASANSWLLSRALPAASRWRLLNLIPLGGMLFDYLENISAALVIGRYPASTPLLAAFAPVFTLLKWAFVGGSFALLCTAAILYVIQNIQKKNG